MRRATARSPPPIPIRSTTAASAAGPTRARDRRRADDHLSLVAGMRRDQTRKLTDVGMCTTRRARRAHCRACTSTASATPSLERLRHQAELQVKSARARAAARRGARARASRQPTPIPTRRGSTAGFAALPAPSPGDLFFDMEGDPYALERRPRVPLRRRRARRDGAPRLPRVLGARPRRGEARVRGSSSTSSMAKLAADPEPARLPLRAVRADRAEAAHGRARHPRDGDRRAAARRAVRRPLRRRAPGRAHRRPSRTRSRRSRSSTCSGPRAR